MIDCHLLSNEIQGLRNEPSWHTEVQLLAPFVGALIPDESAMVPVV